MDADAPIRTLWQQQFTAMDAGDTAALRTVFTPDATLTHMTGFVQPLDAWLAGMDARQFVYHRIEEHDVRVDRVDAASGHLVAHITTGITDDGSGQAWPLRLDQDYAVRDGRWWCVASRVTLDRDRRR